MNPYIYVLSVNGLLFVLSILFYFFPPKKINALYGYRTNRSMLNEDIWKFSNTFFTKQLLLYAILSLIAALILATIATEITWQPMGLVLLSLAVSVIKTEQALNATFNEEGKRK